jgi:hypothetical protein
MIYKALLLSAQKTGQQYIGWLMLNVSKSRLELSSILVPKNLGGMPFSYRFTLKNVEFI